MTDLDRDPVLHALKSAPDVDVDGWRRENLRHQAQAELRRAGDPAPAARLYRRVVEPVAAALVSGGWLLWAAQRVLTLQGG